MDGVSLDIDITDFNPGHGASFCVSVGAKCVHDIGHDLKTNQRKFPIAHTYLVFFEHYSHGSYIDHRPGKPFITLYFDSRQSQWLYIMFRYVGLFRKLALPVKEG